ncbi:MAG: YbaN family protein [Bacteroidota bacterium]
MHKTNLDHKPFFGKNLKPWQKNLYKICGILSFLMGMLGIALPLLPTTPFLLLAVWCYARSSEKLYYWLVYHRVFGEYIRNYRDKKGIPLRIKVGVLVLLWATISFSAFFAVEIIWVRILLMIIAIGVSIHILKIPTLKRKT